MARILVIEDERHISRLIEVNLDRVGYIVEKAYDGVEGLEKVDSFKPDMIILDRIMPRMDGMEVMAKLQADPDLSKIPVIFLTAKGQDQDVFEGWSAGGSVYLTKPFNPKDLLSFVDRILNAPTKDEDEDGYEVEKTYEV